jgi:hypothetical protein
MRRPVCKYCNNKVKSEVYIWVYEQKALIHKQCLRIQKDVLVNLGPIKIEAKGRL